MFNNIKNFLNDRFGYISKPKLFILSLGLFCIVFAVIKINSSNKPVGIEDVNSQIINIDNPSTQGGQTLQNIPQEAQQQVPQQSLQEKPTSTPQQQNIPPLQKITPKAAKKITSGDKRSNTNNIAAKMPNPTAVNNLEEEIEPSPQQAASSSIQNNEVKNVSEEPKSRDVLNKIVESRIKEGLKKSKSAKRSSYTGADVVSKSGKYKLQLLAYSTSTQAKNYAVKVKNKPIFKGKKMFVVQKKVKGKIFYAVQIGVFNGKSNAIAFCSKLKKTKTASSCFVVAA